MGQNSKTPATEAKADPEVASPKPVLPAILVTREVAPIKVEAGNIKPKRVNELKPAKTEDRVHGVARERR